MVLLLSLTLGVRTASAEPLQLRQILQQVIDHYPSVETALLQVQRARLSEAKTRSLLGWQLQAQAGVQRDASQFFGTAIDIFNANTRLSRQLDNGGQLALSAALNRQNSEDSFSIVPNPATSTALDLSYRHPLGKGADNPAYAETRMQAQLDESLALAQRTALYDQLAEQVVELYISARNTHIRQRNLDQAIARSLRRQRYLQQRRELGVAEEKDLLQVEAQIRSQRAERKALDVLWHSQRIQLNRLMGRVADAHLQFEPETLEVIEAALDESVAGLRQKILARHAELADIEARLQLAESRIRLRRDAQKDQLDVVLFVGNRTTRGDVISGTLDASELVGGVRLEYQQQLDRHAVDAELEQAMLDRDLALIQKRQLLQDIDYDIAVLRAQLDTGKQAWQAYQASVASEQRKLREAEQRYRSGRSDTDQLIAFEAQLAGAELSAELRKLELLKNAYRLQLLSGELWQGVRLPAVETEQ